MCGESETGVVVCHEESKDGLWKLPLTLKKTKTVTQAAMAAMIPLEGARPSAGGRATMSRVGRITTVDSGAWMAIELQKEGSSSTLKNGGQTIIGMIVNTTSVQGRVMAGWGRLRETGKVPQLGELVWLGITGQRRLRAVRGTGTSSG